MAGIVSRIFGSFDRVPAPLAYGMMMVVGLAESIALFNGNVATSAPWYIRLAPFAAFGVMVALGVGIIASSRPAVVHRETGPLAQRILLHLQHAGRIATFHALVAVIVFVPVLVVTGKFEDPPQSSVTVVPAKPVESTGVDEPAPNTSAAPSASAPSPSESSTVEDKPAPTAAVTASTPSTSPSGTESENKGGQNGPTGIAARVSPKPPEKKPPTKPPAAPDEVIRPRPDAP